MALDYEAYIEKVMREKHEQNQQYAGDMKTLIASNVGESLFKIIEALVSGYKDACVFAETAKERSVHKGSILALGALVAYVNDLASQHIERDEQRESPDLPFHQSGFSVGATYEEG